MDLIFKEELVIYLSSSQPDQKDLIVIQICVVYI